MYKQRRIYYRKKGKSIIIEGKEKGNSVLIWTLPEPIKLMNIITEKASYFTNEKSNNIKEKIKRLDIRYEKRQEKDSKVPIIPIKRTEFIDAKTLPSLHVPSRDEIKKLWEVTR